MSDIVRKRKENRRKKRRRRKRRWMETGKERNR